MLDATAEHPIYCKAADAVTPIASVTKLMTAMVVLDAGQPLDEIVTVGIADLDLDAERGARQAPAIRFLARTGASRSVQIAVAVDLWDKAGNALPSAAMGPHSIMVDP